MTTITNSTIWTIGNDEVIDLNEGILIEAGTTADTLSGNDSLEGSGGFLQNGFLSWNATQFFNNDLYYGILIGDMNDYSGGSAGNLIMNSGNDSIIGTAEGSQKEDRVFGIAISPGSKITMSGGNNHISGTATGIGGDNPFFYIFGIYNSGSIDIKNGNNNSVNGQGTALSNDNPFNAYLAGGIFNNYIGKITIGNGNNNSINGEGQFSNGIFNRGYISMGNGNNNSITGIGNNDGSYGIFNQSRSLTNDLIFGSIQTNASITIGNGDNNSITGIASEVGVRNVSGGISATIAIGNGDNNSITGIATQDSGIGLENRGLGISATITMGNGDNNSITGIATGNNGVGIKNGLNPTNNGIITMGDGKDTLTGMGDIGILNHGTINMGGGKDTVIAHGGFDGSGTIYLGDGNDLIQGYGKQIVDGGGGKDTADLGIASDDYAIVFGSGTEVKIGDMEFTAVENFVFTDGSYTFDQLSSLV